MPTKDINEYKDIDQTRKVKMFAVTKNKMGQWATIPNLETTYDNYDELEKKSGIGAALMQVKAPFNELKFYWCYEDEDPHRDDVFSYECSYGFQR